MAVHLFYGGAMGPLTAINCEPRQVRKEAAVTMISSVGVRLLVLPPKLLCLI